MASEEQDVPSTSAAGASDPAANADPSNPLVDSIPDVFKAIIGCTKAANAIPKMGAGYEIYSSFPTFADFLDLEAERIETLIQKIYGRAGLKYRIRGSSVEQQQDRLVDVNDVLIERVGNALDEAVGIRRKTTDAPLVVTPSTHDPSEIGTSWNRRLFTRQPAGEEQPQRVIATATRSRRSEVQSPVKLLGSRFVPKPQANFPECIDNSTAPFQPKLRVKHHAKERPPGNIKMEIDGDYIAPSDIDEQTAEHPYSYELVTFAPLPWQLERIESPQDLQRPPPISETKLVKVDTLSDLVQTIETISKEKVIAVDLEHHSYRSFLGLTCLMQISTKSTDIIIDTLALWKELWRMNEVFANPNIVKIFHGADSDILWLERDFGIFVVNMFDTGLASRQLNYPKFSLGWLVHHFVDVSLKKEYQLADWRIRPLPAELVEYARNDTHYLIYCYERLVNELIDCGNEMKNLLTAVLQRSRDLCLKVYEKPALTETSHFDLVAKARKQFNNRQLHALKELYAWRDKRARLEDESISYILPNHMLLHIAEVLPREAQGILACCNPIPPAVKAELYELHRMVYQAREMQLDESTVFGVQPTVRFVPKRVPVPVLMVQRDTSHATADEEADDGATVLDPIPGINARVANMAALKRKPALDLEVYIDKGAIVRERRRQAAEREQQRQAVAAAKRVAEEKAAREAAERVVKQEAIDAEEAERLAREKELFAEDKIQVHAKSLPRKRMKKEIPEPENDNEQPSSSSTKKSKKRPPVVKIEDFDYDQAMDELKEKIDKTRSKLATDDSYDPYKLPRGVKSKRGKKFGGPSGRKSTTAKKHQGNLDHRNV